MSKRKFLPLPEAATLLGEDDESALLSLLAKFLRGELKAKWPREDLGIDGDGYHIIAIGRVPLEWPDLPDEPRPDDGKQPEWHAPIEDPPQRTVYIQTIDPPLEWITREDWRKALPGFSGLGADIDLASFEDLARLPLSAYDPLFRKPYIESLYISERDIAACRESSAPTKAESIERPASGRAKSKKETRGNKTSYPWKTFDAELRRYASVTVRPDRQRAVVERMADWCGAAGWSEVPDPRTLGRQVKAVHDDHSCWKSDKAE